MSTAEINAYLDWRAEREGKTVDVSPEAYEREQIMRRIFDYTKGPYSEEFPMSTEMAELYNLVRMYELLEEEN